MERLPASKLSEKYELQGAPSATVFFDYIIKSYDNGQSKQAFRLYCEMIEHNRIAFASYTQQIGRFDVLIFITQQLAKYAPTPKQIA